MRKRTPEAEVTVVGGGLSGAEAALQLADRGVPVRLLEMRPLAGTGAHRTDRLGEIVCSNSFKSTLPDTAAGLLKEELKILGSRLLEIAYACRVPAGHALAVDRELFSAAVTEAVLSHERIALERILVTDLKLPEPAILATGPLTEASLLDALARHFGRRHLYFYDAISPSVDASSIDISRGFWASRYGKGGADYLNIPLSGKQYRNLLYKIRSAELVAPHAFEEEKYFEACLPVEVMASRGEDTLRFGPLRPKGLRDPRSGERPYAVVQLRQEKRNGSLLGLVGFQTRMTHLSQKEVVRSIPGMEEARILRFGAIHKNSFIDTPRSCRAYLRDRKRAGLFYAGQLCGVEGYMECITSGIVAALEVLCHIADRVLAPLPEVTMVGSLMNYIHAENDRFQPMNANMGLLPSLQWKSGHSRVERKKLLAERALEAMRSYRLANRHLFP